MENMKNTRKNKIMLQDRDKGNTANNGLKSKKKSYDAKRAGSMLTIPTYTRKNLKLTNNVATLVKRYAVYIFN